MKTIKPIIIATALAILTTTTGEAQDSTSHQLDVINQLSSKAAVSNMPVSQLLNAPGNEALKAFFFTPVKDSTALKGKRIAVLPTTDLRKLKC
jgi:protease I